MSLLTPMVCSDLRHSFYSFSCFFFFHSYFLLLGKSFVVRTNEAYTLPAEIAQYVDFVSGVAEFPEVHATLSFSFILISLKPRKPATTSVEGASEGYVTVAHIQDLYQLPKSWPTHPNSSIVSTSFLILHIFKMF